MTTEDLRNEARTLAADLDALAIRLAALRSRLPKAPGIRVDWTGWDDDLDSCPTVGTHSGNGP